MRIFTRYPRITVALAVSCLLSSAAPATAGMEWTEKRKLTLDTAPLDVIATPNGKWVLVLTPGEVLVYSAPDMRIINRLAVDGSYDKLIFSAADEQIILASSAGKTLRFLQIDEVFSFTNEGVPFKGPESAPVTIAVFSDYQ